jgi:hypothetical protein
MPLKIYRRKGFDPRPREGGDTRRSVKWHGWAVSIHAPVKEATPYQ